MNQLERAKELIREITKHNYNYYVLDNPTISDKQYDALYDELVSLEKQLGYALPSSPTQKIGDAVLRGFQKVNHQTRLYSLDKCNTWEELEKWYLDIVKKYGQQQFTVECKYDGLQMTVSYENGIMVRAATRGNGLVGEDVTAQAKTIADIPQVIPFMGKLTVQGEAMMKQSVLSAYNKNASEPLKNARNAAAGAIRNLDPKITKERKLSMFFYGVPTIENKTFDTQVEIFEFLRHNGFPVFSWLHTAQKFEDIKTYVEEIDANKSNWDILLDGAVIKLNNVPLRERLGFTNKFPKWAMAYKFEAQELTSKLNRVVWQVGRTGKVTPIAEIDPIELAGATVKRATLNNYGDILKKGVKINSTVFVRRSNEVIPEILGVAEHFSNSIDIEKPQFCPSCHTPLIEDGANLFCPNYNGCLEQITDRLVHYVGKNAMNIVGINDKIALQLHQNLQVNTPADLYRLTTDDLMTLESFKQKKSTNIMTAIDKSKHPKLANFIFALGINGVGEKTAKDLSNHFKTFDALKNATESELLEVFEIGEVLAKNIHDYFTDFHSLKLLNDLFAAGIEIENNVTQKQQNAAFTGKTVVLTGTLEHHTRDQAKEMLEAVGARVAGSVSPKTDYVLAGSSAGSKLTEAKRLGIRVLSEQEWLDLLNKK